MTAKDVRPLTRVRVRILLLGLLTALAVAAISGRLFYLTVIERESFEERAQHQNQQRLKLDARRGTIRDRNGRELAVSVEVESVYAVPGAFSEDDLPAAAFELGRCLGVSRRRIAASLKGAKNFVWLERKATPEAVRCVKGLNLAGVGFLPESRRFYPKRHLAAQVLGYVGVDNEGMGGVEYALEKEIRGEPGRRIIWTDALRRRAGSRVDERAVPGRSVYLTIDENLQYIAETELSAAVRESGAKSGIAIVLRPHTGELLAIASFPGFNPNRFGDSPESHRRNRSVTDVYEPGSTFKIVAGAAALEEGVVTEDERIDCGRGSIRVADRVIHDSRSFDVLAFREVLQKSSNVGMIRIGQRLGKSRLEDYVRAFGFGETTGVELPAESRGILRPSSTWGPVTAASIAFGQEVSVTSLQMVTAANVLATGGYLMRPRLVLGYGEPDGRLAVPLGPEPVRRVLQETTARRMTEILQGAVERGTGERAAIAGYAVAGKTGTAQKAVLGGYSRTDYIASFVGFAPVGRPEVTALVVLDSPVGDHSGSRAAAVFARIVERALVHLGIPRDDVPTLRLAKVWPQMEPILPLGPIAPPAGSVDPSSVAFTPSRATARANAGISRAPEVIGLPMRDALAGFVAAGLVPAIEGSGVVTAQIPPPGEPLGPGGRARLILGDAAAPDQDGGRELGLPKEPVEPSTRQRVAVRVASVALRRRRPLSLSLRRRSERVA